MWSDSESKSDYLNFSEIAESAADIVNTPELLPISIGIFGDWGAGKSTILKLTRIALEKHSDNYVHIEFDAWLFQGYDDARASILEAIAGALIKYVKDNEGLLKKAKSLAKRVDKIRALGLAADLGASAFGVPTFGAFGKLFSLAGDAYNSEEIDGKELIQNTTKELKEVHKKTKGLIKKEEVKTPPQEIIAFREEYSKLITEIGKPLIVYIDNLDRCTPLNAIQTLEAIRLFLFMPNTAFIIAADEDMIRSAVGEYHKGATERHQTDYLDKLIQVPINVPKPGILEVRAYLLLLLANDIGIGESNSSKLRESLIQSLRNSWKEKPVELADLVSDMSDLPRETLEELESKFTTAERITPLLAGSSQINGNPRIVKRLLNVIKMRKRVSDRREMNLEEALITKLVIFERCAGKKATIELYRQIDESGGFPEILKKLESDEVEMKLPEAWIHVEKFLREWAKLPPLLEKVDLRPAAYLSRETIPLGIVSSALSPAAKELIGILRAVKTRNSPMAKDAITKTPREDYLPVMEEMISPLRTISDWTAKPQGLDGAILLALNDQESKIYLSKFLTNIPKQRWLSPILKELL